MAHSLMITNRNALELARGKQDSEVCVATVRTKTPLLNLKELQRASSMQQERLK
jgi:hypothetical protein